MFFSAYSSTYKTAAVVGTRYKTNYVRTVDAAGTSTAVVGAVGVVGTSVHSVGTAVVGAVGPAGTAVGSVGTAVAIA